MTTPTYAEAIGQATVDAMAGLEALPDRFVDKIMFEPNTGCWLWMAGQNGKGYGVFKPSRSRRNAYAHRYAYEQLVGPIAPGLEIDHLCRVRHCVNPAHLEPVPPVINQQRGNSPNQIINRSGACLRGHPWTPESTYYFPGGKKKRCRICVTADHLRWLHAKIEDDHDGDWQRQRAEYMREWRTKRNLRGSH